MEQFPRQPLFDRIIVEEIPVETFYEKSDLVSDQLLEHSQIKIRSDRGIVRAVGECVVMGGVVLAMPVAVGDIVYFDEFCQYDPVYLNPADALKTDLPKFWQMRVGDLKGVDVARRTEIVDLIEKRKAEQQAAQKLVPITQALQAVN